MIYHSGKKIVLATPLYPPEIGGPAIYAAELKRAFERAGYQSSVVAYGSLEKKLPTGIKHAMYCARLLPRVLTANTVVALDTWLAGFPAFLLAKLFGKKCIVRISGDIVWEWYVESTGDLVKLSEFYDRPHKLSLKQRIIAHGTGVLVRHSDALLFNSRWQREIWQRQYQFDPAKAHIVENAFHPRKAATRPEKKVFVAAGRPIKLKQEELLKRVFADVVKEYPDVVLDIAPLPPAEHEQRVAQSYAVVLASVSDVAPNAIIDAVVYGKPFICTNDTGIRERLEGTGLFVDTQNEFELRTAIESLLDPTKYARIQRRVQEFSFVRTWDEVAGDILSIIKHL
jgi:glycosyltransferase involved in cell wall biosynthesis